MYSIKPGRGPSAMGAISGIIVAVGGVIWTVSAISMGAPGLFALFGVVFVVMAISGVIYNSYNATQKNRMSDFDITSGREESDPIAQALGYEKFNHSTSGNTRKHEGNFCPYCGTKVDSDFEYCPKCGKDI